MCDPSRTRAHRIADGSLAPFVHSTLWWHEARWRFWIPSACSCFRSYPCLRRAGREKVTVFGFHCQRSVLTVIHSFVYYQNIMKVLFWCHSVKYFRPHGRFKISATVLYGRTLDPYLTAKEAEAWQEVTCPMMGLDSSPNMGAGLESFCSLSCGLLFLTLHELPFVAVSWTKSFVLYGGLTNNSIRLVFMG